MQARCSRRGPYGTKEHGQASGRCSNTKLSYLQRACHLQDALRHQNRRGRRFELTSVLPRYNSISLTVVHWVLFYLDDCSVIDLQMAQKYPENSDYEPELSVGLVWRSVDPKATLRIHTTGSITVTGGLFLLVVS